MKDGEKLKIHNWIIEKVEMDGMDYMEVRTVGGEFRVMYRSDHILFGLLDSIEDVDEILKEGLAVVFGNVMATASVMDNEFHHDVVTATSNYISRVGSSVSSDNDEEESQRIIQEMKDEYEADRMAADSLAGENGGEKVVDDE